MNQKEFGQLVATLRKEHLDEEGYLWKQKTLALKTGLSESVIGKIERGEQKKLGEDALLCLADVLQLTTEERRQFFAAASGVSNDKIARRDDDPKESLNRLMDMLKRVSLPAFIEDVYLDLVTVNHALMHLYGFELTDIVNRTGHSINYNVMQLVFSSEYGLQKSVLESRWSDFARYQIKYFRELSFQHRNTEYFRYLISQLRKSRKFNQYWLESSYAEDPPGSEWIYLHHPKWGQLTYIVAIVPVLTSHGDLRLCIYVPISPKTNEATQEIMKQGGDRVYPLASWPEKNIPQT